MPPTQDITFVLHSALITEKYKATRASPVVSGERREHDYELGFNSLVNFFEKAVQVRTLIVDNTIKSSSDFPLRILPEQLSTSQIIASRTNRFGRFNKGAGQLETLRYLIEEKHVTSQFVLFFEPRLQLIDPTFLESFLSRPRTMFCRSSHNSLISGYFGISNSDLRFLCAKGSPLTHVLLRRSIEHTLHNIAVKFNWEVWERSGFCVRNDPVHGAKIY